ncbi:kinase-like domain-containing protein [Aspergillus carlsbadensis]|nr:kinase-like domain-containing protein [Aspergillus carlsbadensis]
MITVSVDRQDGQLQVLHTNTSAPVTQNHPRFEYDWIEDVEDLGGYQPGGYHPIMIGDKLNYDRYHIVDKLGYGGYSTVWLAHDAQLKKYVALKVHVASHPPTDTNILKALSDPSQSQHPGHHLMPTILDEFEVHGPNGTHKCHTTPLAACSIRDLKFNHVLPLEFARALAYGLVLAVSYVHSQGYAHGDLYLANILLKFSASIDALSIEQLYEKYGTPQTIPITRSNGEPLSDNIPTHAVQPLFLGKSMDELTLPEAQLTLSDFGEAFAPGSETRLGMKCNTPDAYRAPEAKFEPNSPISYSSDIWSLATALWDIIGMKTIFSSSWATEDEVASQQVDVLGPMPAEWYAKWEGRRQFWDEEGNSTDYHKGNKWRPLGDEHFEDCVQKWRRKKGWKEIAEDEKTAFFGMMRKMMKFRPEERPTADQVLEDEWMVKWALPDYKRSLEGPSEQSKNASSD